jgi:hypothetical protein
VNRAPSAFKENRAPASLAVMNWDCVQASHLIGKWEVSIQDVEARFIFKKDLYPDTDSIEVPLQDPVAKQVGGKFEFTSDQIELTIKTKKRASICPADGEICYEAKLNKIDIDDVGEETSKELLKAKWSCAPRSN